MIPKFYLISTKLTPEQIESAVKALSITPIDMALIARAQDVETARHFSEKVTGLHRPIAIVADFECLLSAVLEDGKLVSINMEPPNE
jgi:hypothetical protein